MNKYRFIFMMHIFILGMLLSAFTSQEEVKAPKGIFPLPQDKQVRWQQLETYAFIHFGLNTFNNMEWGYGNTPPATFNPNKLDCEQWAATCKAAGMKGIIFTAKHHDGFCLWPTRYTEYNITKSPYKNGKGDIVRELAEACKKYDLKFAVYLSPWDRNAGSYATEKYVTYFHNQLEELLSEYGEVFEIWFDGANGGNGWYGGADETRTIQDGYYRFEDAYKLIDKLQPHAIIFSDGGPGCRWVGNEKGFAGETNWSLLPSGVIKAGTDKLHLLQHGERNGDIWVPAECDVSIRPGWFYHEDQDDKVKSVDQLVDLYYKSVGRNANLLLNFPVNKDGLIHPIDSANAVNFYRAIQQDFQTNLLEKATITASNIRGDKFSPTTVIDGVYDHYWATEDGVQSATITATWKTPQRINRLLLQEYIPLGQRVEKFSVRYWADGRWQNLDIPEETTTIGYKRILRFSEIETTSIRICFEKAKGELCINGMGVYYAVHRGNVEVEEIGEGLPFLIEDATREDIQHLIDGDISTTVSSTDTVWTLCLEQPEKIKEISFLPVQGNPAAGFIHRYEIWVEEAGNNQWKKVATGECSNIRNNPVLQRICFPEVKSNRLRVVATQTIGEGAIEIAELRVR